MEQNLRKLPKKRKIVKSPFDELKNFLFQCLNKVCATNITINGHVLKGKTIAIASKFKDSQLQMFEAYTNSNTLSEIAICPVAAKNKAQSKILNKI